jgi:hypothetical protein
MIIIIIIGLRSVFPTNQCKFCMPLKSDLACFHIINCVLHVLIPCEQLKIFATRILHYYILLFFFIYISFEKFKIIATQNLHKPLILFIYF